MLWSGRPQGAAGTRPLTPGTEPSDARTATPAWALAGAPAPRAPVLCRAPRRPLQLLLPQLQRQGQPRSPLRCPVMEHAAAQAAGLS